MLRVRDIAVSYGPSQALFGVDLMVGAGQMTALMGRNGMGKTTTLRAICGLTPAHGGEITFNGHDLRPLAPHRIARLGIGLVPEGRRCFPNLTVAENLIATARPGPWDLTGVRLLFPRLAERSSQMAVSLSGGEQQMLAIGRALMTNPGLLVLDEATEGLAPVIRQEIWAAVTRLKIEGQSLLIVDKSLGDLIRLSDDCVILEKGRSIWSGLPATLTPDVAHQYLGIG